MKQDYMINTNEIKIVDMFMSDGQGAYADISIESPYIYYCIGTEDTREDGRVTTTEELMCNVRQIVSLDYGDESCGFGDIELKVRVTMNDGKEVKLSGAAQKVVKGLIPLLVEAHDEFMFLNCFKRLL